MAEALPLLSKRGAPTQPLVKVPTPGREKCEDVAALLQLPLTRTVKSVVLAGDPPDAGDSSRPDIWLVLIRGDHELNEVKVSKVPGLDAGFRFATPAEIVDHFGCNPGYLGPIGLSRPVRVAADRTA